MTPYYIHTDHLGSTNVISNSTGELSQIIDYYPYGQERICSGTCNTDKKYIGQYYDNDSALNYFNARYYNSFSGRFISQDRMFWSPEKFLMDPQSLNSYSYARNNPIVFLDSNGQSPEEWITLGYWKQSGNQIIKGNYASDVTLFGTVGQVVTGIFDFDLPGDIRDIVYDFTHWQWSWGHTGQTGLDFLGLVPVVGAFKYSDEVGTLLKGGAKGVNAGDIKGISKAIGGGHSFDKHLGEFKSLGITSKQDFTKHVKNIMEKPDITKSLSDGRMVYGQVSSKTIVIYDPNNLDMGTAFVSDDVIKRINKLK
jgi:RHS repeat-associated protein